MDIIFIVQPGKKGIALTPEQWNQLISVVCSLNLLVVNLFDYRRGMQSKFLYKHWSKNLLAPSNTFKLNLFDHKFPLFLFNFVL